MKKLILILSIFIFCGNVAAQEHICTISEAKEAESTVLLLNNWHDIYKSFKRFRHCDDGAIAEGYSASIMQMLAHRWDQCDMLFNFVSEDKDFYVFVFRHINACVDKSEIEMIINNSSKKCPKTASKICSAIERAAKEALKDAE